MKVSLKKSIWASLRRRSRRCRPCSTTLIHDVLSFRDAIPTTTSQNAPAGKERRAGRLGRSQLQSTSRLLSGPTRRQAKSDYFPAFAVCLGIATPAYLSGTERTSHTAMQQYEARKSALQFLARRTEQGGTNGHRRPRAGMKSPAKAQTGTVRLSCSLGLGAECRWFESSRPDHSLTP